MIIKESSTRESGMCFWHSHSQRVNTELCPLHSILDYDRAFTENILSLFVAVSTSIR